MSIIYDALKKVEEAAAGAAGKTPGAKAAGHKRLKINPVVFYVVVACLGIIAASAAFHFFMPRQKKITRPKQQPVALPQAQPKPQAPPVAAEPAPAETRPIEAHKPAHFQLNGVFYSGQEGYALINNRIVEEGDTIAGAVVEKIGLDEVVLKADGAEIKLSADAAAR